MVNVGIVGLGFMGMIHYDTYQRLRGARVRAICEQLPHRLRGDWRDIKGNFGPVGRRVDLSGVATSADIEPLLADPTIDLVDICLPPALHAEIAIRALRAGKHVFCEKPMALHEKDTRRMVAAAKTHGRLLLVGHVLPMFPEYRFLVRAAQKGTYGRLLGGHFQRVISDPAWLQGYYDPDWIGGPMLDLHIHDAHLIGLLFGRPRGVQGIGRMRGDVAEYFQTQFLFDDPVLVVSATSGVIHQPGRSFLHGYEAHFETATVSFLFGVQEDEGRAWMPLTVLRKNGRVEQPRLGTGDPMEAFLAELKEVIRGVRTGQPADFLTHALAADAIRLGHAETRSIRSGRRVTLD